VPLYYYSAFCTQYQPARPAARSTPECPFGSLADTQMAENFRMAEFGVRTRPRVSAFGQ
jgi:hypothetical protein